MRTACFAALLIVATAAPAQTQAPAAGTQSQTTTAAPAQSSCGLACVVQDSAPAAPAAGSTKIPRNLEKLAKNKSDLDKVVCEKEETMGTRLGAKKVCMTVAQWLAYQADVQDQTRRIRILGAVSH
jgi:hypothetical protein